jgi:hypothetical protein
MRCLDAIDSILHHHTFGRRGTEFSRGRQKDVRSWFLVKDVLARNNRIPKLERQPDRFEVRTDFYQIGARGNGDP